MLVADADVPGPVVDALKTLSYPIATFEDFQKMADMILRDGAKWEATAAREPSVISVGTKGSRYRPWGNIPPHTLPEGHTRT